MAENFIRIPPDSTGKRIRHISISEIIITNEELKPVYGDIIKGNTSEATGRFTGASRKSDVKYFLEDVTGEFSVGETLEVNNQQVATIVENIGEIYTQSNHISDADEPDNSLKIDKRGAAAVRFSEGEPQFDALGHIQVSQMQSVGEYYFVGEDQPGKYWTQLVGGGSFEYLPRESAIVMRIGTANGDISRRTTNQYHPYKPGTSQLIISTLMVGDNGKANVVRQWGYYDSNNGFGFRLNGTQLQVFLRSDVSGVITEEVINQSDWNQTTLNNPELSEYILDVSKMNIYWMDMTAYGTGRIRMGVISPDGRRITLHQFENANKLSTPQMRSGNLPMRWGQYNTGVSASTSEMKVICGAVFTESADIKYSGVLIHTAPPEAVVIPKNDKYIPFLNFRAKLTINGLPNRIIGIHEDFDWCAMGNSPLHIGIFVFPDTSYLTGAKWSSKIAPATMLEVDRNCTSIPQYQSWSTAAQFVGSIGGTTLTVDSITAGALEDDQYIVGPGIAAGTKIIGYGTGNGGVGTYTLNKSQTMGNTAFTAHYSIKPIESFIAGPNSADRIRLGDRLEKSFGLAADGVSQACFVFAAKAINTLTTDEIKLFYTKYWKEIR